jgi:hypothetical protein
MFLQRRISSIHTRCVPSKPPKNGRFGGGYVRRVFKPWRRLSRGNFRKTGDNPPCGRSQVAESSRAKTHFARRDETSPAIVGRPGLGLRPIDESEDLQRARASADQRRASVKQERTHGPAPVLQT